MLLILVGFHSHKLWLKLSVVERRHKKVFFFFFYQIQTKAAQDGPVIFLQKTESKHDKLLESVVLSVA